MNHLRPLLTATALAAALLSPAASTASPASTASTEAAAAAARGGDRVRLDGVRVRLRPGTRQVVTVNRTSGHHARVVYWQRSEGRWRRQFTAHDGRVGYGGLVRATRRVQGSGKTPLGTFRLPWAFGMHQQRDRWDPSYRKVRRGDYWVLDNESRYYNRYRNKRQGEFRWRLGASHPDSSERLRDYRQQYEWAVTTSFNRRQVRHRGGAIFLHVNGGGATAGCVSAPRWFLKRLMRRLDPDRAPVMGVGR
ncbi:L,D-transpeptidase family protein [Nocardioides sp. GXQ0305]|uniref:L,D-transpeptidase family protein n=1 Tax=Nocardioides sp. GXQ0305 TaxID=3423912 RepID=UPI003D7CEBFA